MANGGGHGKRDAPECAIAGARRHAEAQGEEGRRGHAGRDGERHACHEGTEGHAGRGG